MDINKILREDNKVLYCPYYSYKDYILKSNTLFISKLNIIGNGLK